MITCTAENCLNKIMFNDPNFLYNFSNIFFVPTDTGVVYSWGSNAFGQLGRPEVKKRICEPVCFHIFCPFSSLMIEIIISAHLHATGIIFDAVKVPCSM